MYYLSLSIFLSCILHTARCKQPNVVVIIADDLGWNDVSFHGSNQFMTPNIDALAYNGIILNRHYVMPTCTPSRSAYLTGRYPIHNGMQGLPIGAGQVRGIPLSEKLLPQSVGAGMDAWRNTSEAWQDFVGHYLTDLLTDEAVNIIKNHNAEKPLYLQIAHGAPHAGNEGTRMEVRDIAENEQMFPHIADTNRRLYAGMVRAVDDSVGNIVKALSESGLLDNSVVVFMSDNGAPTAETTFNTGNHGSNWPLRGEKCSGHEGGVRGAAAVWSGLFQKGVVSLDMIHITDWLPTLYEAAGGNVSLLRHLDGVSQLSALKTESTPTDSPRKNVLIEINHNINSYSMISGKWKIIKYNMSSILGFSNYFYGTSGRRSDCPVYNNTEVQRSAVGLALVKYGKLNESQYIELRQQANIESLCSAVALNQTSNVEMCDNRYCLFNIIDDPCEVQDLSTVHPDILNQLLQMLKEFNTTVVPISNDMYKADPRANPKYWHNYWNPWLDNVPDTDSSNVVYVNIYLLLMLIAINFFFIINY